MYDDLIQRIRKKSERDSARHLKPESSTTVEEATTLLGFELNPLLREVYLQLGAGVGPADGILPLLTNDTESLVGMYKANCDSDTFGLAPPMAP